MSPLRRRAIASFSIVWAVFVQDALPAAARPVNYQAELAFDAALLGLSLSIPQLSPDHSAWERGDFPTQAVDDWMHRKVHGAPDSAATTPREEQFRQVSDVAVVSAVALPAGLALASGGEPMPGQLAVTLHAMMVSNTAVTLLKHAVRRPRPKVRFHDKVPAKGDDILSFPSGHSSAAFTGATLVQELFPEAPVAVRIGAYGLAVATALARMGGDKHFFTDVVAGAAIGSASAMIVARSFADQDKIQEDKSRSAKLRLNVLPTTIGFQLNF